MYGSAQNCQKVFTSSDISGILSWDTQSVDTTYLAAGIPSATDITGKDFNTAKIVVDTSAGATLSATI